MQIVGDDVGKAEARRTAGVSLSIDLMLRQLTVTMLEYEGDTVVRTYGEAIRKSKS